MVLTLVYCRGCLSNWEESRPVFIFSGFLWLILWKGNEFVSDFADTKVSWMSRPVWRLSLGLFLHIIYSVSAVAGLNVLISWVNTRQFVWDLDSFLQFSIPAVLITVFISLALTARTFLFSWRKLAVQHEKLKTEAITSRFSALKNQVNPHFLFNSLNVLSNLVHKDPNQATEFIHKLAEVYRFVLDSQQKETVPLADEIAFVSSFIYLQKMRFGKHLEIHLDLPDESEIVVPPLSIQMLIENAIKHNEISKKHPLTIHVRKEGDFILVENNVQVKELAAERKNGIGLDNIRARYRFLTDREVSIVKNLKHFKVYLPILYHTA